ncbi:MAG: hypothetical protein Q4F17_07480 [Eubacteriales bacterium]|nr:hypothetical protein [Eubacteriales bacterium]
MKEKATKWLEVVIESIHFIIIHYALSNMTMLLKSNPIFILFFTSEILLIGNYFRKLSDLTKSEVIAAVLLILCLAIHIGMVYYLGRFVGELVPFRQVSAG